MINGEMQMQNAEIVLMCRDGIVLLKLFIKHSQLIDKGLDRITDQRVS